jgi:hypothetical protein
MIMMVQSQGENRKFGIQREQGQLVEHDLEHGLKCVEVGGQEDFTITNLPTVLSCLISSFASALSLCLSTRLKLHGLWQGGPESSLMLCAISHP